MVIVFPTTKSDLEGKHCSPKHVYANTTCPDICPILSFAVYFFTLGMRREGSRCAVFGENVKGVEDRFGSWLGKVASVESVSAVLVQMGISRVEIGTHSFRKGVATYLSSMVSGPSAIAIYLRAGWSLGPVQSRYIMEGQGGDQLCGRAATGLSMTCIEFSNLPPHFNLSDGPILTLEQWEDIIPGYRTYYPSSFHQVIPFLLASLVYHKQWLVNTLPNAHPLFNSRVWSSPIFDSLSDKVLSGNGHNATSGLTATGIPPHVLIANEIAQLRSEFGDQLREHRLAVISKLDEQRVEFNGKLEELPMKLKECLLQNFAIEGIVPITAEQVVSMISSVQTNILAAMQEQAEATSRAIAGAATRSTPPISVDNSTEQNADWKWLWGGRFHPVPRGYIFPR